MRFYLENWNDAGKIWIQRPFPVHPNRRYAVKVSYAFASRDPGIINLWRIITGVLPAPPRGRDDLEYQDETGNGAESDVGYRWMEKRYDFEATAGSDGLLYVLIGVWGTWETPRTYYIDAVSITFSPK